MMLIATALTKPTSTAFGTKRTIEPDPGQAERQHPHAGEDRERDARVAAWAGRRLCIWARRR